jgi:hypothetical protein
MGREVGESMKYQLEVTKICSATIEIEADDEDHARARAEYYKYHMMLNWR